MKQAINPKTALLINGFKHTMYALQVVMIVIAIPLLTCIEIAHTPKQPNVVKEKKEQVTKNFA